MSVVTFDGDSVAEVLGKFKDYINDKNRTCGQTSVSNKTVAKTDISKIWWMDKHEMDNGNVVGCVYLYVPFIKKSTAEIYIETESDGSVTLHVSYENDCEFLKGCCQSVFNVDDKVHMKFSLGTDITENDIDAKFCENGTLGISFRRLKTKKPAKKSIKIRTDK